MQSATSLKRPLAFYAPHLSAPAQDQKPLTPNRSINKDSTEKSKPQGSLAFSKKNPSFLHLPDEDWIKAEHCLSTIEDPLWKIVCRDFLNMMGSASVLKIWDSTLGEVYFRSKNIELFCKTEEAAQFIQLYNFVILGSLQVYIPSLNQLQIKTVQTSALTNL